MAAARTNGKSIPESCWSGWLGIDGPAKGGKTKANELHISQCEPAGAASPAISAAVALAVLTKQSPPSLPVRTSSASMDAGATKADNTARKLKKAAMRLHKGRTEDGGELLNTMRIIETPSTFHAINKTITWQHSEKTAARRQFCKLQSRPAPLAM
jgi:hypothetical protein